MLAIHIDVLLLFPSTQADERRAIIHDQVEAWEKSAVELRRSGDYITTPRQV
jgi:hypothetical protein